MSIEELEDKIKNIEKLLGDQRSYNFGNVEEQFKEVNEKINEIYDKFDEIEKEIESNYNELEEELYINEDNKVQIKKIIEALQKHRILKEEFEITTKENDFGDDFDWE